MASASIWTAPASSCRRRTPATTFADYAKPFDTVYVSLYKYFNAASGAILAGRATSSTGCSRPADVRRRVDAVWPYALVARHYLDGFGQRYRHRRQDLGGLDRGLPQDAFAVERVPSGTNLFRLRVRGTDPARSATAGRARVLLAAPQGDAFLVGVNETLNRTTAGELIDAFRGARA
jgi:threonine aldolase